MAAMYQFLLARLQLSACGNTARSFVLGKTIIYPHWGSDMDRQEAERYIG
jgi:hypothetical protein